MNTTNEKKNELQKVTAVRTGITQVTAEKPNPGINVAISFLERISTVYSQLAIRPVQQLDCRIIGIPRIRISLYEGAISVNGRKVRLPLGISGIMTGKEFKRFADIYAGDALFIHRNNGLQRVSDSESIDVVSDTEFTHRMEQPEIRSVPRFNRD